MPINYPAVKPSNQDFTAPEWPTTKVRSQGGVTTVRQWGSMPSGAKMTLNYNVISDNNAAAIIQAHYDARGTVIDLALPSIVFSGASTSLRAWLDLTAMSGGIKWYFADGEPPRAEYRAPQKRRMSVNLIAEIRLS